MKFVNLKSAKGLTPGKEVYTINENGEHGTAKLLSRIEDEKGLQLVFEIPQYFDAEKPAIAPLKVTNITHVCLMKDRKSDS